MKYSYALTVCLLIFAGVFCINTIGHTQTTRQSNATVTPSFAYATLSTQSIRENNGMVYTLTWNSGINDVIGRSNRSLTDARRKLNSQLGGSNASRTNLSVLLTTIGSNGWRLIETNQTEFGTTRIFIKNQPQQR